MERAPENQSKGKWEQWKKKLNAKRKWEDLQGKKTGTPNEEVKLLREEMQTRREEVGALKEEVRTQRKEVVTGE